MLRNLFLALLLANFLVFAWQRWIVPPEAEAPWRDTRFDGRRLVAISDAGDAGEAGSEWPAASRLAPGEAGCVRIGPFSEDGAADAVARRLAADGLDVRRSSRQGRIWIGHWVQLPDLDSREEADAAVSRLVAGGIPDAYIVSTSPAYKISLGVFRERERAASVADIATKLGFEPVMLDRFRAGTEYWLTVAVRAGQTFDPAQARADSARILRTEVVPCAPAAGGDPAL